MSTCACCGNDYDKAFRVTTADGDTLTFDSFECAIHMLAPECQVCGCRIVGHGVEQEGELFCGAHCAAAVGKHRVKDRA